MKRVNETLSPELQQKMKELIDGMADCDMYIAIAMDLDDQEMIASARKARQRLELDYRNLKKGIDAPHKANGQEEYEEMLLSMVAFI